MKEVRYANIDENQARRKTVSKKDRAIIAKKTDGKCGYCGIELPNKWHVDHIVPIASNAGTHKMENLMAACPQCNRFKSSFTLEQFRRELGFQLENARKYSVNFRFAEKYKQVEPCPKPIVFYFEKSNKEAVADIDENESGFCNKCLRCTREMEDIGKRCKLPQPSGLRCTGTFTKGR